MLEPDYFLNRFQTCIAHMHSALMGMLLIIHTTQTCISSVSNPSDDTEF